MSWLEGNRGRAARWLAIAALGTSLAGCFRPLYGPTASGVPLSSALASIEVGNVAVPAGQERLTHYLRSELIFELNGSGQPAPKRYKLQLAASEALLSPIIDAETGRAETATLNATVTYQLTTLDGSRVITSGKAVGTATYDRTPQRFATVRAARDADIRLAKLLAEQIKTRLAIVLATDAGS